MDDRCIALQAWLANTVGLSEFSFELLVGDASFRRYFRVIQSDRSFIAMDAPPVDEDCHPFIAIAQAFTENGIHVPEIHASDLVQGFLLLSDFGDGLLLHSLNNETADDLYHTAMQTLLKIQTVRTVERWPLPAFDRNFILTECQRFPDWYLDRHLGWQISREFHACFEKSVALLAENAQAQTHCCVHRDYHSRNLILLSDGDLGVIDFQDAVWGPVTYDLVSLLRDCYIAWPVERVRKWVIEYKKMAEQAGLLPVISDKVFIRDFDFIGIQRHIKVIGIFARLALRDNKQAYLKDIPMAFNYLLEVTQDYPEFSQLRSYLKEIAQCSRQ